MSILASFATACGIIIAAFAFVVGFLYFLDWADKHPVTSAFIFGLFTTGLLTFIIWKSTNPC